MRLTGGRARGIPLKAPDEGTRPATDQLREAVFSSLAARIPGARVLDLFAGSGSYGLEAWSRGADRVVFIEKNYRFCRCSCLYVAWIVVLPPATLQYGIVESVLFLTKYICSNKSKNDRKFYKLSLKNRL